MLDAITATYASSGASSGRGDVADVEALGRVLGRRLHAGEQLDVLPPHEGRPVVVGDGQRGDLVPAGARLDGVADLLHRQKLPAGSQGGESAQLASSHARLSRLLDRAIQGAERGATLTSRLLAFARRQELQVEFVALQRLIPEMLDFLRHSVGPNIVIHVEISPEVCAIEVDANQLELALINLAVNARDAMPHGGSLTIACHNEENGKRIGLPRDPFVFITVTDTGEGMSEATLARAQEPFFTTKGVRQGYWPRWLNGTRIHGAVRRRDAGEEPLGEGQSVTIWLPRAKGEQGS